MTGIRSAVFVKNPRILSDLSQGSHIGIVHPYEIIKSIALSRIDYENFCADMLADRSYLEEYAPMCQKGAVWKCLLIFQEESGEGILVMPRGRFVAMAAFFHQE
ncbi:MAG: hypothetical protein IJ137_03665 [Eubacterium sp.]|nr:hypothetical protein [Eubacterium sp.]